MSDLTQQIQQQVSDAIQSGEALSLHGSGSHDFLLPEYRLSQHIDLAAHSGIIDYQPSELTLKARAGTALLEIQQTLAENNQRLATDFPLLSERTTLGGALSIGHTGPGRPFLGGLRDHVLGASLINGHGNLIHCGGQVMKNVAGYDVSRLLSGSRGTLGPILDITVKVMPAPEKQVTLEFEQEENQAIESMNRMAGRSLPMTACIHHQGRLYIRLEGSRAGVDHAVQSLDGKTVPNATEFWTSICNQTHEFFTAAPSLWRVIVPTTTPRLELERGHQTLIDWCGGLRWIHAEQVTQSDFIHVSNAGGYIENYRCESPTQPADLMNPLQRQMHEKIRMAFDPQRLFNPALAKFS